MTFVTLPILTNNISKSENRQFPECPAFNRSTSVSAWLTSYTGSIHLQHHLSLWEAAEDSLDILKASTQNEVNKVATMPNGHIKRGH